MRCSVYLYTFEEITINHYNFLIHGVHFSLNATTPIRSKCIYCVDDTRFRTGAYYVRKIWATNQLAPKSVGDFNFLKDGRHYTRLERNAIVRFDLVNGEPVETIYSAGDAF